MKKILLLTAILAAIVIVVIIIYSIPDKKADISPNCRFHVKAQTIDISSIPRSELPTYLSGYLFNTFGSPETDNEDLAENCRLWIDYGVWINNILTDSWFLENGKLNIPAFEGKCTCKLTE